MKFHKMLIEKGKRSGFYTVVSITIERVSQLRSQEGERRIETDE